MTDNGWMYYSEKNKYCPIFDVAPAQGGIVDTHTMMSDGEKFTFGKAEKECKSILQDAMLAGKPYKGFFTHTPKDPDGKLWYRGKHCYLCKNDNTLITNEKGINNDELINMQTIIPRKLQGQYLKRGEVIFDNLPDDIKALYTTKVASAEALTNLRNEKKNHIDPTTCTWDMLSDTDKSPYTLKNNCTWENLSANNRNQGCASSGMIKPDNCKWDDLSEEKRTQGMRSRGMIMPNQCNWDNLSEDKRTQGMRSRGMITRNNCSWDDLSEEKRTQGMRSRGMINPSSCDWVNLSQNKKNIVKEREWLVTRNNCSWNDLSEEKRTQGMRSRGMIMPNQCNWDNLSEDKRTAANDIAKEGMIIPNNCTWANLSEEEKNKRKNKRLEELEEDDSDDDLVECEINENEVMCGDGL